MGRAILWILGGVAVIVVLSKFTQTGRNFMQTITDAGVKAIAAFEGFSATPYNDPPGSSKWSIGFGHQIQPGESLTNITVEHGHALLAADTLIAQNAVRSAITHPLTNAQFDALTSFVFNVGVSAFKTGTVPAKINAGNFPAAAATIRQYNKSGGTVNPILEARRDKEASTFA
jgi:lysozyme